MANFTPELIAKAKTAKSAEELFAMAKADNVELTEEEANTYFAQLNGNEAVSDDDLNQVAGGGSCPGDEDESEYHDHHSLPIGTHVRLIDGTRCSKCGSNVGTVRSTAYTGATVVNLIGVYCVPCATWIVGGIKKSAVEVC